MSYSSFQEIGTHLQLQHSLPDIFAEVASGSRAVLIIDGLDGLRDTTLLSGYRKLIALAIKSGVRVIASIRSFDLRYSSELQEIFPASKQEIFTKNFQLPEFSRISHVSIPELDETEFNQVINQLPIIKNVLENAPQLVPIVHNLFNLDLLCKLISGGYSINQLSRISTQAELFERHWQKRIESHPLREEMTENLKSLIEKMVDQKTLQVASDKIPTQVNDALFSSDFIRHPVAQPGRLPEQELIEFTHHLLFDYAAELLFVRPRRKNLAMELANPNTWALFLRPSLALYYRFAWTHGRDDFWDTIINLEKSSVPLIHIFPAYLLVADEALIITDLQVLFDKCLTDDLDRPHWINVTNGVITAAVFSSLPRLFSTATGDWWLELAKKLVSTDMPELVFAGSKLLFSASDKIENLSTHARLALNESSIQMIKFHWSRDLLQPNPAIRMPIKWLCRTISSNLPASSEFIVKMVEPDELKRAGYIQAYEVASNIKDIWQADPTLATKVYDAIFGYSEIDTSVTSMGSGQILSLTSSKKQDYDMAYFLLSDKYAAFLATHSREATEALIKVIRHYLQQNHFRSDPQSTKTFTWAGQMCELQPDYSYILDNCDSDEYPLKMLKVWKEWLVTLNDNDQLQEKWEAVTKVLVEENELAIIWRSLLTAGSLSPFFYAEHLWTILVNPIILSNITETARDCIHAFAPQLSNEALSKIELAVLSMDNAQSMDDNDISKEKYLRLKLTLLQAIPEEIRGTATKEFLSNCDVEPLQFSDRHLRTISSVQPVSSEMWLAEQGIDTTKQRNHELIEASDFLENISSKDITEANLKGILEKIRLIKQLLKSNEGIEGRIASIIEDRLTRGYAQLACSQVALNVQLTKELFEHFRTILLRDLQTASSQSVGQTRIFTWDTFDGKINSAQGLVCLALKTNELVDDHKLLLRRIAEDHNKNVRFQLSQRICSVFDKYPEFTLEILELWESEIKNQTESDEVLAVALSSNLFWRLLRNNSTRTSEFLRNLIANAQASTSKELLRICGSWLAALSFCKQETWSMEVLSGKISNIKDNLEELEGALNVTIDTLLPRTRKLCKNDQHQKAITFLLSLLGAASRSLEAYSLEVKNLPVLSRPSKQPLWVSQLYQFFDHTTMEFRFSAEEHAKQWINSEEKVTKEQIDIWRETTEPILESLLAIPHPHIAYYLIEGLENVIWFDVQRGLYWLKRITTASAPFGLASEPLAADHTIQILGRILAEHKDALKTNNACSDFIEILDEYLKIGWPSAVTISMQIEFFR